MSMTGSWFKTPMKICGSSPYDYRDEQAKQLHMTNKKTNIIYI